VVQLAGRNAVVAMISSQMDLYDAKRDFLLDHNDPEFRDTGLDRPCYVYGAYVASVPRRKLTDKLGRLGPRTSAAFEAWWDMIRLRPM
jgi:hypothetical protein